MPFASSLSVHPDPAQAVGEIVGEVLDQLGHAPDLAVLFFTAAHVPAAEEMAATVQTLLDPGAFIGASASALLCGHQGVEDRPAMALWAARVDGVIAPVHLTAQPAGSAGLESPESPTKGAVQQPWTFTGLPDDLAASARSLILLPDPFTFPLDEFMASTRRSHPGLSIVGGLASAASGPGGNRLLIGGRVARHGAVGVLLAADVVPDTVVSQGCRPIGQPFTVTRSDRNVLFELGGHPALDRLLQTIEALSPDDRELASRGLHCGIVAAEHKLDFERGDFLIRGVLGADRATKAVAVGDEVPVGATVQFQVRDAATAGEDLRLLLAGHDADAALVFTCNGRGAFMFGSADHDAEIVAEHVGGPVAGMFCAGEIGPVAGRNALHGFTASVALFRDP